MQLNDTQLAVLRILARAEAPWTVREITSRTKGLHPAGGPLSTSTVRNAVRALEWNDGNFNLPLVAKIGYIAGAATWAITPAGREALAEVK